MDPDPVGRNLWQDPDQDAKKIILDPGSSESEMNYKLINLPTFQVNAQLKKNTSKKLEFGINLVHILQKLISRPNFRSKLRCFRIHAGSDAGFRSDPDRENYHFGSTNTGPTASVKFRIPAGNIVRVSAFMHDLKQDSDLD